MQHNGAMKTAITRQVRVQSQLRVDLDAVLREGEALSEVSEARIGRAVECRPAQNEFRARADAAWAQYQATGEARPAEAVIAELQARLETCRKELQGKHRPSAA